MIVIVGNTSLNVALPRLAEDLNATTSDLQWIVDAYSLVFAGSSSQPKESIKVIVEN